MSVLGLASLYNVPLYAKTPKEIVKYQLHPKDGKKCKSCLHFIPETNECKTVEGSIDPEGWCTIYFRHPNYKEEEVKGENNESNESNITADTI